MKSVRKRLAITALVGALCLLLSSCGLLDELRAEYTYYTDETHEAVVYQGNTYRKLNVTDRSVQFLQHTYLTVCEKDVPLLLSPVPGEFGLTLTPQGTVITDGESIHYCREDVYDDYCEQLAAGMGESLCIVPVGEYEFKPVNPAVIATLEQVLETGDTYPVDRDEAEVERPLYRYNAGSEILWEWGCLLEMSGGKLYLWQHGNGPYAKKLSKAEEILCEELLY